MLLLSCSLIWWPWLGSARLGFCSSRPSPLISAWSPFSPGPLQGSSLLSWLLGLLFSSSSLLSSVCLLICSAWSAGRGLLSWVHLICSARSEPVGKFGGEYLSLDLVLLVPTNLATGQSIVWHSVSFEVYLLLSFFCCCFCWPGLGSARCWWAWSWHRCSSPLPGDGSRLLSWPTFLAFIFIPPSVTQHMLLHFVQLG